MSELEPLRNHWWWRPGWRVGRSFYAFHITFAEQPAVARLAADYVSMLNRLPMFDPVPERWLHLTMQGVGFTDEVGRSDVEQIVVAAQQRCAQLQPFTVTLGPAVPDPEGIPLLTTPAGPLARVRQTIRDAIGDVWGPENVPEPADGFRAHVSLGYSNSVGPAEPVAEALVRHGEHTAEVMVSAVSLIDLNRDHKAYEWTDVATVRLGAP